MRDASKLDDRKDSGMTETEIGIPYTLGECELVAKNQRMDEYHRLLFNFLINRVKRLSNELDPG